MNIKQISPYPDHCSVTLDMPWDVAEALVSSGPALIASLREVVNQYKKKVEEDGRLNSLRNKNAPAPELEWWPLAVKADKRIRSLMNNEGLSFSKATSIAAKEYHFPYSSMQAMISVHRKFVKEEKARLRTLEIIQLHFRGVSSQIIADHLYINPRTVQRTLKENGDLVEFARSELNEILSDNFCRQGVMSETALREEGRASARPTTSTKKPLLKKPSSRLQAENDLSTRSTFEVNIDERKQEHRKIGVQCYRNYRRANPTSKTGRTICKELGFIHGLDAVYIEHLIRVRRRIVKAYLRSRQLGAILKLRADKVPLVKVATVVKLHVKTVEKILREHNTQQRKEISHDRT